MKKISKLILGNLIILIVLLVILEIVFRMLGFGYGNSPLDSDNVMHHVHPKNYVFDSYHPGNEYGGFKIYYDERGNRYNPKDDNKGKDEIWFLGDSYTEALQVTWDSSFVGRTGHASNYKVINFGTSSYSPLLYVIQLNDLLQHASVKPKFVFVQIYNNDVRDDESYAKDTKFDKDSLPVACDGGRRNVLNTLLRRLYVIRAAGKAYHTLEYLFTKKKNNRNLVAKSYNEELPDIQHSRFETSLQQLEKMLADHHIAHRFFAIPSKYSSITGDWSIPTFSRSLNAYFERSGIPHIDMDGQFSKQPDAGKLFFTRDIHLTNYGHRVVAGRIMKYIEEGL